MKVFFDTEFTGLRQSTSLISIGCVAENGHTFYAECTDYDREQVNQWLSDNVIAHLNLHLPDPHPEYGVSEAWASYVDKRHPKAIGGRSFVASCLGDWLADLGPVEMWSDCLAYDWVLFCEMFGGAFGIPESVYYIPFDLSTLLKIKGVDSDVSREEYAGMTEGGPKHNALWDAKVIKACYEKAMTVMP